MSVNLKGKIYRNQNEQIVENANDITKLDERITDLEESVEESIGEINENFSNYVSKANLTDHSINEISAGASEIDSDNVDLNALYSQDVKSELSLDPNSAILRTMNGTDVSTVGISATEIDITTPMLKYGTHEVATKNDIAGKQDTLVSGTNIKTINNQSLLGSGNISIAGGSEIKTLVWTNPSPTADFEAGARQLDFTGITNPKYVEIEWKRSTTTDNIKLERYAYVLDTKNVVSEIDMQPSGVPTCIIRGREFWFQISVERPFARFEDNYKSVAFNTPSVENSCLIPYKIYIIE